MNKYYNFKFADFIDDPAFRDWVYGKPGKSATDWQQLGEAHPALRKEMEVARLFLQNIDGGRPNVSDAYIKDFGDSIIEKHNHKSRPEFSPFSRSSYKNLSFLLSMAAMVAVVFGLGWYYLIFAHDESMKTGNVLTWIRSEDKIVRKTNESSKPQIIALEDGSKITLQPNSSVIYPEVFEGKERNVQLSGEAFFDVKRNPDKPFLVHFNNLIVKVLGTSFTIRSFDREDKIKVTVKTGKVAVFAEKSEARSKKQKEPVRAAIMLTANQEISYKRSMGYFERSVATTTQIVDPKITEADFEFTQTPLSVVLDKLEKAYGIPVIYDQQQVKECSLTASLADEPLMEKINMICKTMNASYEMVDGQIVLDVKSCRAIQ